MRSTLKARIITSVLVCFIAVWFPSILILFSHMNKEVYDEASSVVREQVGNALGEVNDDIFSIVDAISWICSEKSVAEAFEYSSLDERGAAVAVLEAQRRIEAYMAASSVSSSLNKIILFSPDSSLFFEYTVWRSGTLGDVDLILSSPEFQNLSFPPGVIVSISLGRTLNPVSELCVIAYGKVRDSNAYVYAEFSAEIFEPLISIFPDIYIYSSDYSYPGAIPDVLWQSDYTRSIYSLDIPDVKAIHFQERMPLSIISSSGLAVFALVIVASILLFILVSVLLSRYLTKASSKLVRHIEYLMDTKDFGYTDKTIESGDKELAQIGHAVNAMSISISSLLKSNEKLFEDKKRMEIDMLQMQVNPHFLYNTLESMHYLAEVQRNEGIARMSRGLSTLLRNMAKGSSDRIPLREELSLLRDYDDIQQVRYMGMYELVCDVPDSLLDYTVQKFTLQPLVENSIFHGIEPAGRFGTITVSASLDGNTLQLVVADDGVGMAEDEIRNIFRERKHSKTDMTGVGLRNINERIKLVYGEEYGLSFESEKGSWTKVIVRVRAEREDEI